MAFKGKELIKTKLVIDTKTIEQTQHFTYLGCDITCDYYHDAQNKLRKFQHISRTLIRTLKRKTIPDTQLTFYKAMAIPTFLYVSETWTLCTEDLSRMKFLRSTKGCTILDKIRNDTILQELKIFCPSDKIKQYRQVWMRHVQRMPRGRLPKAALYYRPKGRRDRGRSRKRWVGLGCRCKAGFRRRH